MYIVQLTDLHIGSATEISMAENRIIDSSIEELKKHIKNKSKILFLITGDIVDNKPKTDDSGIPKNIPKEEIKKRYKKAKEYISLYKQRLEDEYGYTISFAFCVGNHDVPHIDEFVEFAKEFTPTISKEEYLTSYKYEDEEEGVSIVLVNSCHENSYKQGGIDDFDSFKNCVESCNPNNSIFIALHHTIISMDDEDVSAIINSAKLIRLVRNSNVKAIFHGHTHGRSSIPLYNQYQIDDSFSFIGTGALFSRGYPDVNSQFTIAEVDNAGIMKLLDIRFLYDLDGGKWNVTDLLWKGQNYFSSDKFSKIYNNLIKRLKNHYPLYNVVLNVESSLDDYMIDMEGIEKENISIGGNTFSYKKLAEMWEDKCVPTELYFNHGSFFEVNEEEGIKYIAMILGNNRSSSKAILKTYSMKDVVEAAENKREFLPSLSSIQFGLIGDRTLYVHMYLRALEAIRFLKINACEIKYLINRLKTEGCVFDQIKIVISAYRVQGINNFSCFVKSSIDKLPSDKLGVYVARKPNSYICSLLKEKIDDEETITISSGIRTLIDAMKVTNEEDENRYPVSAIKSLENAAIKYDELAKLQKKTSIHDKEEKIKKEIKKYVNECIKVLEQE